MESSRSSYSGGPAISRTSNPLTQLWIVKPDLAETFFFVCRKNDFLYIKLDLEDQPRQLKELKWVVEEKKIKRDSKQCSDGLQTKHRSLQNDIFCIYFAIGYNKDYCGKKFTDEFWVASDGKVDGNSCTRWCYLRCFRQGFSTEQDSYFCFCVLLVKKPDFWGKKSRKTLIVHNLFQVFFCYP